MATATTKRERYVIARFIGESNGKLWRNDVYGLCVRHDSYGRVFITTLPNTVHQPNDFFRHHSCWYASEEAFNKNWETIVSTNQPNQ